MIREENLDLVPIDLVMEILSRLPAKSIARFCCVSKLWRSILLRPYFTDLFVTRSSSRPPRLLFVVERSNDDCCFFTSPQKPIDDESSSANFHMKFHGVKWPMFCGHASGFMLFSQWPEVFMCNPSTGQNFCLYLPRKRTCDINYLLGFDPIDKQFKLLYLSYSSIMTLGTGNDSWRMINCPLNYNLPSLPGICIDGVLYYIAANPNDSKIVCFDVRSEIFNFMNTYPISFNYTSKLINYKGKLGMITREFDHYRDRCLNLCLCVMNPNNSEWSKYVSFCLEDYDKRYHSSIVGMTANDEFVLATHYASEPFYVYYLNPTTKTIQRVEIKGFGVNRRRHKSCSRVEVFGDYIEDLHMLQHP